MDYMRDKGRTYHKHLMLVFTIIAVVLSAALIVASVLIGRNTRISVDHVKQSLTEMSANSVASTMSRIQDTIDYLSTSEAVPVWIRSMEGSSGYYFGAVQVFKELGRRSPMINNYSYSISLTTKSPDFFVITPDGTQSKKDFISSFSIDDEGFYTFEPGVYLSLSGSDDSIVLVFDRYIGRDTLVIICRIPFALFSVPDDSGVELAIIDEVNSRIISESSDLSAALSSHYFDSIFDENGEIEDFNAKIEEFPYFGFSLVYAYKSDMIPTILLVILVIPLIIATIALAYRTQRSLYEPVRTAYESLKDDGVDDDGNEFDTIIAKCREAEDALERIDEMADEIQSASETQKYRAYLRGADSSSRLADDETAFFSLAILVSEAEQEGMQTALLLHVGSLAKTVPHLHFILMDDGTATLVYKTEDSASAFPMLSKFVKDYASADDEVIIQAAVTYPARGWRSIKGLYNKAKEIIGYRYIYRDKIILTEKDIRSNQLMRYPIASERRLVNAALSASPDVLLIFDEIVADNTDPERMIPESELRQLAKALSSTVQRVFQEIKEDPGESIDWKKLREADDPMKAIGEMRRILSSYIEKKTEEDEKKYSRVVVAMKEYIKKHYAEPIMLVDLSDEFGLSPKYCSEIFNRVSGDTFKNYLNRFRINEAKIILDSGSNIKINDLAKIVGFASSNTFIRVFDKYMGMTPKNYAERIHEKGKS